MDSILVTIRDALGIDDDYSGFDGEIILAVNNAIMLLSQLGIGPTDGYLITGVEETWTNLFDSVSNIEGVKSYILLKTRLQFDPPTTSFLLQAINNQIKELEWRLMVQVDPDFVVEE